MTYSGDVSPGSAPDLRELPDALIGKLSVSEMNNNCYLITDRATGTQALIDAADDAPALLSWISSGGRTLESIITTHQHWDHHRALASVVAETGARTYAGRDDASGLPVAVDRPLDHGDQVRVGELVLDVVVLRGHTPGSVALVLTSSDGSVHAFTGDSLFPGGVGNTHGNTADFESLITDVEERIFGAYGDATWIYPGHGNDTTLGAERPALPEWRQRGW